MSKGISITHIIYCFALLCRIRHFAFWLPMQPKRTTASQSERLLKQPPVPRKSPFSRNSKQRKCVHTYPYFKIFCLLGKSPNPCEIIFLENEKICFSAKSKTARCRQLTTCVQSSFLIWIRVYIPFCFLQAVYQFR